jgi:hypothetical protein
MEDLLDSWPGTLLVVSHDRYLIERVTDQQYALLDGHLRHLPGGVEESLKLRAGGRAPAKPVDRDSAGGASGLAGAERRDAEKELAATDRRLAKLAAAIRSMHDEFAAHDQSDYAGLGVLQGKLSELESEAAALEERWLELSTRLEG